MSDSGVVILATCSNGKERGGSAYEQGTSLLAELPTDLSHELVSRRQKALTILRTTNAVSDGRLLREVQCNRALSYGPDFGGDANASYLPALCRYAGRFYMELGEKDTRLRTVRQMPHRMLMLSALYGMVAAAEPIQEYDCPFEDPRHLDLWVGDGFLTRLLVQFLNHLGSAVLLLDVTGDENYRSLLDWSLLVDRVRARHVYSGRMGASSLPCLGAFAKEHLLSSGAVSPLQWPEPQSFACKDDIVTVTASLDARTKRPFVRPAKRVRMLPSRKPAANWAEEKIYEACVQALDQHYTVYHSVDWLQLEKTGQPREGETDFIVTHPDHGVLFVEVKGGQVEFDPETGEWTRLTDRGIREVIKNPVKQAKDGQNWFLRRLTNTLEGAGRGRWTIGYAVAFPQVATKAPLVGVDLPEALILDSRDMRQMAAWVHAAFSFWRGKEPLLRQSQRAMVDHLRRLLARGVSEASQH